MNTRALFNPATNAMTLVRNEVERMFDNVFSSGGRAFPSLNMIDDDNHVYIEAELPGVQMENLEVSLVDGELTISGRREVHAPTGASTVRRERGVLEFDRTISIPVNVEADGIQAVLREGILTLSMPKTARAVAHRVTVTQG